MIDDSGDCCVTDVREWDCRLVVVGLGLECPKKKAFQVEPVQDRHDRGVGERAEGLDRELDISNGDGRPLPDRLHDDEFQRRQCQRITSLDLLFDLQEVPTSPARPLFLERGAEWI